jgi:predicted nucleic acid-binding protein
VGTRGIRTVTDAGPLVHLAEIGCFPLLSVFESICIPDAVWQETVERGRVSLSHISGLHNIRRYTLSQPETSLFVKRNGLEVLHLGESECLCLCKQIAVQHLLTDDLAVRQAARLIDLVPVGSLGVVVRAYRLEHIPLAEAEHYLMDLYSVSSLFVTKTIVELAIEELRSYSRKNAD